MKAFLLFLLLAAPVYAHTTVGEAAAGPYYIELTTLPDKLEPGDSTIVINVLLNDRPAADKEVWIRLSDDKKVYLAGTFHTDEQGAVAISYYFNGPGSYTLTTEIDGERVEMPLHVHGEYVLLFGFLAAIFIAIALLFDRKGETTKGF